MRNNPCNLTSEELDVVYLLKKGYSIRVAAFMMDEKETTIRMRLHRIYEKTGLQNLNQLLISDSDMRLPSYFQALKNTFLL